MLKKILFIIILLILALIIIFMQDNKQEITPKQKKPLVEEKIKIDYSKTPIDKQKIKTHRTDNAIYDNKNTQTEVDKYKKPLNIKETSQKEPTSKISIDGSVTFSKEKRDLDGANINLHKRF